jgi:hypothetical protein
MNPVSKRATAAPGSCLASRIEQAQIGNSSACPKPVKATTSGGPQPSLRLASISVN